MTAPKIAVLLSWNKLDTDSEFSSTWPWKEENGRLYAAVLAESVEKAIADVRSCFCFEHHGPLDGLTHQVMKPGWTPWTMFPRKVYSVWDEGSAAAPDAAAAPAPEPAETASDVVATAPMERGALLGISEDAAFTAVAAALHLGIREMHGILAREFTTFKHLWLVDRRRAAVALVQEFVKANKQSRLGLDTHEQIGVARHTWYDQIFQKGYGMSPRTMADLFHEGKQPMIMSAFAVFDRLGHKVVPRKRLAKEMGISENDIRRVLVEAGFSYSDVRWRYLMESGPVSRKVLMVLKMHNVARRYAFAFANLTGDPPPDWSYKAATKPTPAPQAAIVTKVADSVPAKVADSVPAKVADSVQAPPIAGAQFLLDLDPKRFVKLSFTVSLSASQEELWTNAYYASVGNLLTDIRTRARQAAAAKGIQVPDSDAFDVTVTAFEQGKCIWDATSEVPSLPPSGAVPPVRRAKPAAIAPAAEVQAAPTAAQDAKPSTVVPVLGTRPPAPPAFSHAVVLMAERIFAKNVTVNDPRYDPRYSTSRNVARAAEDAIALAQIFQDTMSACNPRRETYAAAIKTFTRLFDGEIVEIVDHGSSATPRKMTRIVGVGAAIAEAMRQAAIVKGEDVTGIRVFAIIMANKSIGYVLRDKAGIRFMPYPAAQMPKIEAVAEIFADMLRGTYKTLDALDAALSRVGYPYEPPPV